MNPKKPKGRKSISAGISLEPELKARSRTYAISKGFNNLSAFVRHLIINSLKEAGELGNENLKLSDAAEDIGHEKIKQSGIKKSSGRAK